MQPGVAYLIYYFHRLASKSVGTNCAWAVYPSTKWHGIKLPLLPLVIKKSMVFVRELGKAFETLPLLFWYIPVLAMNICRSL